MIYDIWYVIHDIRYTIYDTRYTIHDIRYTIYDIRYTIHDTWYMIYDMWYVICDIWHILYHVSYMMYHISCLIYHSGVPKTGILETRILQNEVDLILQESTLEETSSGSMAKASENRIFSRLPACTQIGLSWRTTQNHFIMI